MYYYPFLLHLFHVFSFTNHHPDMTQMAVPSIPLWSISIRQGGKQGSKTYTSLYHPFTQTFEFNGKRYTDYGQMVDAAYCVEKN